MGLTFVSLFLFLNFQSRDSTDTPTQPLEIEFGIDRLIPGRSVENAAQQAQK